MRPILNLKCRRKRQRGEPRAGQTTWSTVQTLPTSIKCCYSSSHATSCSKRPQVLTREGRITTTYLQMGKLRHEAIHNLTKATKQGSSRASDLPSASLQAAPKRALKVLSGFITYFQRCCLEIRLNITQVSLELQLWHLLNK